MSKNSSGLFSRQNAAKPHLVRGSGGAMGEIADLRLDIVAEFARTRATAIEEFTNIAVTDPVALSAAITTEPTSVTSFLAGGVAALAAIPRNLTFTVGGTAAHIPPSLTILGKDAAGLDLSETVSLTGNPGQGGTGLISATKCFKSVTSVTFGTWAGASGTLSIGIGTKCGLSNKIRGRAGLFSILREIVGGVDITAGQATDEFTNLPAASTTAITSFSDASTPTLAAGGTQTETQLTGATNNDPMAAPRNLTVTASNVSSFTPSGSVTVVGEDVYGNTITEAIAITAGTTVVGAKAFKRVVSVTVPVQADGAGETVSVGFGALIGFLQKARVKTGETTLNPIQQVAVGAVVTTGTFALPAVGVPNGTYSPASAADGTRDYALTYLVERGAVQDPTTAPPYGAYVPSIDGNGMDIAIAYEYDATAP